MAVALVAGVEKLIDKGGHQFVHEVVATFRANAPVDTGQLVGSIRSHRITLGRYEVSTNAHGHNGVEYPLHIEYGEVVFATKKKALHFVSHGKNIVAKSAAPSKQSHFARNTISKYGGIYTGK